MHSFTHSLVGRYVAVAMHSLYSHCPVSDLPQSGGICTPLCIMMENRSSCQVEQLSCACLLDSATDCHWMIRNGPIRHRANGAVGALCNSPNCLVATRLDGCQQDHNGPGRVLVTGGAGYFGFRLGQALAHQGVSVILLDLHKPPWDIPDGAVFYQVKWNWRSQW